MREKEDFENMTSSIEECIYCHSFCKSICPTFEATRNVKYLPSSITYLFNLYENNKIDLTKNLVTTVFNFTGEKLCDEYCIFDGKNLEDIIRYIRKNFYLKSKELLPEGIRDLINNVKKSGNIFGETPKLLVKNTHVNNYDILIFAGCLVNHKVPELLEDFLKFIDYFDIRYKLIDEEICSGAPFFNLGIIDVAEELAHKNIKIIEKYKPPLIVTLSKDDFKALAYDYKKIGIDIKAKIMDYPQFIGLLTGSKKFAALHTENLRDKISIYDPIDVGVNPELFDYPRKIIESFTHSQVKEFPRNRELSRSCGGYIQFYNHTLAESLAKKILYDFQSLDSEYLITTDPLCCYILKKYRENGIKVVELISYITKLLEK